MTPARHTTPSLVAGQIVVALCAFASPAWAAGDVDVGGYHEEVLREAYQALVAGHDGGGVRITVGGAGPSALSSSFTPRFGGLGFAGSGVGDVDQGVQLKRSFDAPATRTRRGLRLAPTEGAEIAGLEVGWSAIAEVDGVAAAEAAGDPNFMVGGELALAGVRLDAAFGDEPGLLGLDGQRLSAGLGYTAGSVGARVGYSLVEDELRPTDTSMFTLGSHLALRPGLVVQGDLAYAQGEEGTAPTAAGLVSLRLSF